MNPLTLEHIEKFRENATKDCSVRTLNAAMGRADIKDLAFLPLESAKLQGPFSLELKTRGITAQKISGRCWMFAFMNVLREVVAEKCNLEKFGISGNYLAFFDKLEKANNALESAIAHADKPLSDRMTEYILGCFGDGGNWTMAVDLVKKYGVVPNYVMPESYQSTHTANFMTLFKTLVRKDIAELRAMVQKGEDPTARKEEMMAEIFKMECIVFGEPTKSFDFEYKDKDGEYHVDRGLTPKAFFDKYIGMDLNEYVTVTNYPIDALPMNGPYTYHCDGNMIENNCTCLNLTSEALENLCLTQLKAGELVWFGCDSTAFGARAEGIWDPDCFDYEGLLGNVSLYMDKKVRLEHHDTSATHAMVLMGVNFDKDGKPNRWKIENSWGDEVGQKGYFVCSEKYFKEYVYEAIINKKHLTQAQLEMLKQQPVVIEPWVADKL